MLQARLMAVGALLSGLGYAFMFGTSNIASLEYGSFYNDLGSVISPSDAFSISFWLIWSGVVLFPVGLAILAYGVGAQETSTESASTETRSTEAGI